MKYNLTFLSGPKTIRISRNHFASDAFVQAVGLLNAGGVVAYPTETSYGLAADPSNEAALKKIFAIKGRSKDKPSPLIASSFEQAKKIVRFDAANKKFAQKHWPGPFTLVLPLRKKAKISKLAQGPGRTIAIRVPSSAIARALAEKFGKPITSTSANLSGRPNIYSGSALKKLFAKRKHRPDLILDAGRLPKRRPSTILRIHRGGIEVLRQGSGIVA